MAKKKELGESTQSYKEEYDQELKALGSKTTYGNRRKKHVQTKPKQGFLAVAVRHFYTDLCKVKQDDQQLVKAVKFASGVTKSIYQMTFCKGNNLPEKCYYILL